MDFIILGAIALIVACIVAGMVRRKRRCKGGCAGCPYSGQCGK
ncbi:MAG: FeoB-associated Cys-rich membrane protein [Firmicutes bacterium]|nr:FeoB-associated Cys-rich membrane protein [Bacillota bacterium]